MIIFGHTELVTNDNNNNKFGVRHIISIGPLSLHQNCIECGIVYGKDPKLCELFKKSTKLNESTFESISNEYNSHSIWLSIKTRSQCEKGSGVYEYNTKDSNNYQTGCVCFDSLNEIHLNYLHWIFDKTKCKVYIVSSRCKDFEYPEFYDDANWNDDEWKNHDKGTHYYLLGSYDLNNIELNTKMVFGLKGYKENLINQLLNYNIEYLQSTIINEHNLGYKENIDFVVSYPERYDWFAQKPIVASNCSWGCML